MEKSRETATIT